MKGLTLKPRTVYRIQWHEPKAIWCCVVDRNLICAGGGFSKPQAVKSIQTLANAMLEQGFNSQLVIHGKNGRIQREYTYGADPRRSKG